MGNVDTKPDMVPPSVNTTISNIEVGKAENFGSYNDPEHPRPGYYLHKGKRQVFYRGKLLPKADFDTFKKLGQGYAEDKNYKYFKGKIVKN